MLTIVETGRKFRSRELSPETLVEMYLDRIRRDNPKLNAYYEVFWDEARQAAAEASRELRSGLDRGPLHGIPIGVKDLFDVKGYRTTAGAHPGFHPAAAIEDASVIARLRAAGAILLGKTSLHEWAFGVSTNNAHFGPTRNPHDPTRMVGGSSGGSGAALAADLCLGALGTDTGGSIRIPSSLCGTVGIKPTLGRVSTQGVTPLSRSLDTVGPMARTVDDAFLLLDALCGFRPEPTPQPRIVVPEGYFLDDCDPRIIALVSRVGALEKVDLGDVKAVWEANGVILLSDASSVHEGRLREHPDWFGESVGPRLQMGLGLRGVDYARAREEQRQWTTRLERILGKDTVLAVPSTPAPATIIGDREGAPLSRLMTRYTSPFNLAGVPVLCLPAGMVDGLPVGLQLVAGAGQESLLRTAAALLES
ncbi:MAG TPA: amidase [Planctomycetota bacterium]|nr:amidase [Planctomycetota bacterium]